MTNVKMNAVKMFSAVVALSGLLLASCGGAMGFSSPIEVASDAAGAQFLLSGISAGFYLGEDSDGLVLSRTVNPDYDNKDGVD
jgi:hypothetical protein